MKSFNWKWLLLTQLMTLGFDLILKLVLQWSAGSPASFIWSRLLIAETMAFSIVFAILWAELAVERGAPEFRTYTLALVTAALFAATFQYALRSVLGFYTLQDRPGISHAVRVTQMVYVACDTMTYGLVIALAYVDFRRRQQWTQQLRKVELERADYERGLVELQVEAVSSRFDPQQVVAELMELKSLYEQGSAAADTRLASLTSRLRDSVEAMKP